MRELIVSEAPLPRVAGHVKAVAEDQGGVVSSHTHHATEFDNLRARDDNWSRSGYIGTYQPFKQDQVRIRIRVWASWPKRLFRFFLYLGFAEAVLFFLMSLFQVPPPPNVWIVTAILTFLAIGISLLTYSTSWATSSEVEDTLARHIGSEIRADEILDGDVYTLGAWEEHRQDLIDETVQDAKATRAEKHKAQTTAAGGGLLTKVKRRTGLGGDKDDQAPEAEPGEEPAAAQEDDEAEESSGGFRSKLPFLGSKEEEADDDQEADQAPAGTPEDDEVEDEEESSGGLRSKLPFFGSKAQETDDEPEEEPAAAEEDDEIDEDESSGGLMSKLPFLGSKEEDADDEVGADQDDDQDEEQARQG